MIPRILRLLMVAILALALPVKGIASVTMPGCISHPAPGVALAAEYHSHPGAETGHDHASSADGSDDRGQAHDADKISSGSQGDAQPKCGTCAPCCAGAALTDSITIAASHHSGRADFPPSSALHPSGRNNRLDRPPRQLLA